MTNPHRGDTEIEVGGEKYLLCYDLNACAEVMDHLGIKSFDALGSLDLSQVSISDVIHLLWAGLQRHHPEFSQHDVGQMEWDLNEHLPIIGEAFNRGLVRQSAQDSVEGGAEGNVKKKKAGKRTTGAGKKPSD